MIRKITKKQLIVFIVFALGVFARVLFLDSMPDGLNQDEAYAGYEAYSLLHYGVDSWGYSFPVYLTTWGSGMSIMNSYLMIPFIWTIGPTVLAARLPQAILGLLTVFTFYKLFNLLFPNDNTISLIALFILAINPWHILMCRWALDCNMAPAFLLIAFYFFCRGVDEPKFFILSFLFYGLTLYCYALTWVFVPVFLFLQLLFLFWTRRIKISRYLIISVLIICILAVPLLLFILVNSGRIDELKIGLISVPRMPMYRASEIDLENQKGRLLAFAKSLITQNDGLIWNYAGRFGLYYKWGLPFAVLVIIELVRRGGKCLFKREYHPEVMFLLQFCFCILFSSLIDTNFSKMNSIHFPVLALMVIGIRLFFEWFRNAGLRKAVFATSWIVGLLSFVLFERYYFGDYRTKTAECYRSGLRECVEYAECIAGDSTIFIYDYASHPCVLFYEQIPVTDDGLVRSRQAGITVDTFSNICISSGQPVSGDICIYYQNSLPGWVADNNVLFSEGVFAVVEMPEESEQ